MSKILTAKNILIIIGLIIFDLAVYILLGIKQMNYDDFYYESKGEYWSFESMTLGQKANYIGLNIWHLVNVIVIGYVIYRVVKLMKKTPGNETGAR
jgi:hypothetical protein